MLLAGRRGALAELGGLWGREMGSDLSLRGGPGLTEGCLLHRDCLVWFGRRKEMWEIASMVLTLAACCIPGRKAQMIKRCSSQLYSIPRLLVLSKCTQKSHKLSNISGQCVAASWHKAAQSAGATAFRKAEPWCQS